MLPWSVLKIIGWAMFSASFSALIQREASMVLYHVYLFIMLGIARLKVYIIFKQFTPLFTLLCGIISS